MPASETPSTLRQLTSVLKKGEGPELEFKRSTGELREGMQTLCAFLNRSGGMVVFGIRPDGAILGQEVSDQTVREIAQAADRLEPPAHISIHRLKSGPGRQVVLAAVEGGLNFRPYTYDGRAYERVGSTTRRMPQAKYERLLVERGHAKRRWENLPAEGLTLKDLDRREILLNAVIHRDYSHYSGSVAIAVFDDRIEIVSYGRLPTGITVKQLSRQHDSKPVNPLIAGAFHRTGAVEVWGRGTNKVINLCKRHGAQPPIFEERQGFLAVTFPAQMVAGGITGKATPQATPEATPQATPQVESALRAARAQAKTREELQEASGIKDREHFRKAYLEPMLARGWLMRTIPDKPRSPLQRYRITEAGLIVLNGVEGKAL